MPMATPQHATLVADTERVFALDANCGTVRIVVYENPATIFVNTKNVPVPAIAASQDGNEVIPGVTAVVELVDQTPGNSIVRVRSTGTPKVMVTGW